MEANKRMHMRRRREFIWCLVELTSGRREWYCISRMLRQALFAERKINPFWKNTLIGCYLNVGRSAYRYDIARIAVAKVVKIRIFHHGPRDWHWTRNQFVTPEHLEKSVRDCYHYLKHDYIWYNRLAIWHSLFYWHLKLKEKKISRLQKKLNKIRGRYFVRR